MNKETKIGMLTGLGVIVLIGVLLSQYFDRDNRAQRPSAMKDVGENYRLTAASPMGVPRVAEGAGETQQTGDGGAPLAYATSSGDSTPRAAVAAGPVVGAPVTAMPVGRIPDGPADAATGGQAPTLPNDVAMAGGAVTPAVYVPGDAQHMGGAALPAVGGAVTGAPIVAPAATQYQIAKGDTLSAIALKFYHSSGKAAIARIVAANPTVLKNENTPLVMGKKLSIPAAVATSAAPAASAGAAHGASAPAHPGLVIRPAGSEAATASHTPASTPTATRIEAPATGKTYTVQKGDSLSKIAAKFLGSSSKAAQDKIVALNKLKGTGLREGEVLKIPAKT